MLAFVISFVVGFTVVTMYTVYKDFKEENERFEESIANKKKLDLNAIVVDVLVEIFRNLFK